MSGNLSGIANNNAISLQARKEALLVHTESDEIQHPSGKHPGRAEHRCHSGKGANARHTATRSYANSRGNRLGATLNTTIFKL